MDEVRLKDRQKFYRFWTMTKGGDGPCISSWTNGLKTKKYGHRFQSGTSSFIDTPDISLGFAKNDIAFLQPLSKPYMYEFHESMKMFNINTSTYKKPTISKTI